MPSLSVRLLATQDSNRAKTLSKELLEKQADVLEFSEALGQLSFEKETEEVSFETCLACIFCLAFPVSLFLGLNLTVCS